MTNSTNVETKVSLEKAESRTSTSLNSQSANHENRTEHEIVDKEAQAAPGPEAPPRDISGWRWAAAMTAILMSMFLYALDITVVASVQPLIVTEFDAVDKLSWLSVAVLLGACCTNMIWGRIYTQFNSKWLYLFNVFLFEVGSAICGAAPNMDVLIVGRAICGVSGSGLYVGIMTLIAITTTMAERPLYISATGLLWGLGIVLGPVVGGGFGESSVGWRWAFYINLLIGAACAPAWLFLLPSKDPRPGVSIKQRLTEVDYVGSILFIGAMTCFVLAINWGGVTYLWSSGRIIGLFVAAGVLFILVGIQQVWTIYTTLARRIIPVQFFKSRTVLILFSSTAAGGTAAFVSIYFVPLFFQFTRADNALQAGVRLMPFIVVLVVFILINGSVMAKLGYYMHWFLVGGVLTVIGSALMFTVGQDTAEARVYGYTVLIGVGVGSFLQASFSVAQAVVDPQDVPPAVGFITLAQYFGITMGLAISNTVFLNLSEKKIAQILPDRSAADIESAIEGAAGGFLNSLTADERTRVLGAITDSISTTYVLVIAAGSLVTILSLLLKREKLFVKGGVPGA